MLTAHLTQGVKLIGLYKLIMQPAAAFDGCYRVVNVGTVKAIEFFDSSARAGATTMQQLRILPYRTGMINETAVGGVEVISGEFTGCVMTLFRRGTTLLAGHVDTAAGTTQRGNYDALKTNNGISVVAEYDTTGKLTPEAGCDGSSVILCVASSDGTIKSYFVQKSSHQSGKMAAGPGGDSEIKWRQVGETVYTVTREC